MVTKTVRRTSFCSQSSGGLWEGAQRGSAPHFLPISFSPLGPNKKRIEEIDEYKAEVNSLGNRVTYTQLSIDEEVPDHTSFT